LIQEGYGVSGQYRCCGAKRNSVFLRRDGMMPCWSGARVPPLPRGWASRSWPTHHASGSGAPLLRRTSGVDPSSVIRDEEPGLSTERQRPPGNCPDETGTMPTSWPGPHLAPWP